MKFNIFFKRRWLLAVILIVCGTIVMTSCQKDDDHPATNHINYHFAPKVEGQELMRSNTGFFNSLNQNDIEWRMKRTGATLDELKDFAQSCVLDFTTEEKAAILDALFRCQSTHYISFLSSLVI